MVRLALLFVPSFVLLFLVSGCGPRQSDIERSIRDEMKSSLNVVITSIDLKKLSDGGYTGTATAQNGDVYEVTALPPKNNKSEWKAIPGQAMVEQVVRSGLEKQLSCKVKTLQLTKNGPGIYTGPAELSTNQRVIVTTRMEGKQLLWEAQMAGP
jgi:hypothetical protein